MGGSGRQRRPLNGFSPDEAPQARRERGSWRMRAASTTVLVALVATALVVQPGAGEAAASGARALPTPELAASTTTRSGSVVPVWPIGHRGRWLTDGLGRVVLPHGVNMVSKQLPSPAERGFDAEDMDWLVANGFDVVRLGFTAAAMMPEPGIIDQHYLDSFVSTVHELTARGLLVLIDLHQDGFNDQLCLDGFPAWMTLTHGAPNTGPHGLPWCYVANPAVGAAFQSLWDDEPGPGGMTLQARVAEQFGALAAAVGSDPGVLGWDLMNEPWPGTGTTSCYATPAGCPDLDRRRLGTYYARMAGAIRAHDPGHLLFAEPNAGFALGLAVTGVPRPADDPLSGLAYHDYGQTDGLRDAIHTYAEVWARRTDGALLVGELGAIPGPDAISHLLDRADADLVPWIWWSYADNDGGGALIRDLATPPTEANLYGEKVDRLVRPHPVAVAGTPVSVTVDRAARRLDAVWSTVGPDGHAFGSDAPSIIDLPSRAYPDGWHATVHGGTATVTDDGAHLLVEAEPGSPCVHLVVDPGARPVVTAPGEPERCPSVATSTTTSTATSTTAPATSTTGPPPEAATTASTSNGPTGASASVGPAPVTAVPARPTFTG